MWHNMQIFDEHAKAETCTQLRLLHVAKTEIWWEPESPHLCHTDHFSNILVNH